MEALIFIGIQAAGKSSFYRERFFNSHIRINLDMLRTRHRESLLIKACIEAKQPFVVDNTNITREQRARYFELLRDSRFTINAYYFLTTVADAVARNSNRVGKELIPNIAIAGTFRRLEKPAVNEGFAEIYQVRCAADRTFIVEDYQYEI